MILLYLIKSTLCLSVLILFFKLVLESKAMHQFKRFYLLAAILFSFTLPLITFTYEVEVTTNDLWMEDFSTAYTQDVLEKNTIIAQPEVEKDITPIILWSVYVLGVLLFGSRYIIHLLRLRQKIKAAQKINQEEFTLALLSKSIIPHSFLRWIFISKAQYKQQKIAPEIIAHEATHVRQKHSLDILFIECMQVIFWFNPLIWLTKKSIKLNHEFLADQGAINNNRDIAIYQNLLLRYASSSHQTTLESPFNYSLIKKRIVMLSQSINPKKILLRVLLLIPVLGLCLLFFNNDIIAQSKKANSNDLIGEWLDKRTEIVTTKIYKENDSLWYSYYNSKQPVLKDNNGYYLQEIKDVVLEFNPKQNDYYFHLNKKGELQFTSNSRSLVKKENSIKQSLVGSWQKENSQKIVNFSLHKVALKYSLTKNGKEGKSYVAIIKDQGVTIPSLGNSIFFKRKGSILTDKDGNTYNQIPNYASQFIKGAKRNDKKPLVIEIKNNTINVNNKPSSRKTFVEDINAITKDWSADDFKNPAQSYLFKDNSTAFLNTLEKEYAKTAIANKTGNSKLVPPAPPSPPSPAPPTQTLPAPPLPPSVEDHLFKMNRLGGIFFYENKEITYKKAQELIKDTTKIKVNTPYSNSNPPKTFISKQ